MVKFNLENLNLEELLEYIRKLKIDIQFNDWNLKHCRDYEYGLKHNKFGDMSEEEYRLSNIEQFINDKDFIKSFIINAEESYEYFGDFKNVFDIYEEKGLAEEQIGDLLEYCDKNDLISY